MEKLPDNAVERIKKFREKYPHIGLFYAKHYLMKNAWIVEKAIKDAKTDFDNSMIRDWIHTQRLYRKS